MALIAGLFALPLPAQREGRLACGLILILAILGLIEWARRRPGGGQ